MYPYVLACTHVRISSIFCLKCSQWALTPTAALLAWDQRALEFPTWWLWEVLHWQMCGPFLTFQMSFLYQHWNNYNHETLFQEDTHPFQGHWGNEARVRSSVRTKSVASCSVTVGLANPNVEFCFRAKNCWMSSSELCLEQLMGLHCLCFPFVSHYLGYTLVFVRLSRQHFLLALPLSRGCAMPGEGRNHGCWMDPIFRDEETQAQRDWATGPRLYSSSVLEVGFRPRQSAQ